MSKLEITETKSGLNLQRLAKAIIFSYLDSSDYGRELIANIPNVSDFEREQIRGAVWELVNSADEKTTWDEYDEIEVVLDAKTRMPNAPTALQQSVAPDPKQRHSNQSVPASTCGAVLGG